MIGAEGFYNDLLDATFIASEDRHRYIKRRVLTEFRQLQRFGRLFKWPADQPLLAKHKSSKPVETFTPPYVIIPLIGFPPSIIFTGLSPGAYK